MSADELLKEIAKISSWMVRCEGVPDSDGPHKTQPVRVAEERRYREKLRLAGEKLRVLSEKLYNFSHGGFPSAD